MRNYNKRSHLCISKKNLHDISERAGVFNNRKCSTSIIENKRFYKVVACDNSKNNKGNNLKIQL